MAQLAIAAVGAVVGSAFGPLGTSVGWALGSAIGSQFGPKQNSHGPRLNDLKVTSGQYGDPIPWVMGHPRVAGQVWWASDRREISETSEVGKGGGGATTTSYTYEVDLLIGLTDTVIVDVSRIWLNGKLVYVTLSTADPESIENSVDNPNWEALTVYTGGPAQLPDPVYEAAVGVGNAPAYRGRGMVMIEGLKLGNSGVIPNLTFEIATSNEAANSSILLNGTFDERLVDNSCYDRGDAQLTSNPPAGSFSASGYTFLQDSSSTGDGAKFFGWQFAINMHTAVETTIEVFFTVGASYGSPNVGLYVFVVGQSLSVNNAAYSVYMDPFTSTLFVREAFFGDSPTQSGVARNAEHHLAIVVPAAASAGDPVRFYLDGVQFWTRSSKAVLTGSIDKIALGGITGYVPPTIAHDVTYRGVRVTRGIVYPGGTSFTPPAAFDAPICVPATGIDDATLQDTVEALCARCNMSAGEYDASALAAITKPVRAMAVGQVTPTRAVLEQLQAAYFFDAYATDKLYFVPRAGSVAQAISADDLATAPDAPEVDVLPMQIGSNAEIAAQVSVTYANVDADYTNDTQHSDRLLTGQVNTSALQIPLAFTSSEAKGIADAIVLDGYASRITGTMALPLAYGDLVPTDVVTVPDEAGNTYRVRLVRRIDENSMLRFEWALDDATAIESAGITSEDYAPVIDVALPGGASMELLDIPLLRDEENYLGHYVAATSASASWPGASIQRSVDDVEYTEAAVINERAVLGAATTALADFTGGQVFDETSSVTVNVGIGALSSSTRAAMLADTSINLMSIGSELIRFRTATMLNQGLYALSGLLRGQKGTEWAMGTHIIGDPVVLLRTQGLRYVRIDLPSVGAERWYKGVTKGRALSTASSEAFTCAAVSLKPLAPVDLRTSLNSLNGVITATWKRRTRLDASFTGPAGAVVPLGEATEAYEIEVLDGAEVILSTSSTEPSAALDASASLFSLAYPMTHIQKVGDFYYGARINLTQQSMLRLNSADGTWSRQGAVFGTNVQAVAADGTNFYAAVNINNGVSAGEIRRIDFSSDVTIAFIAATLGGTTPACFGGLVHDGTDLWATDRNAGHLLRLDDSTLAIVNTYAPGGEPNAMTYSGGSLWVCDSESDELVEFDPSDGSEVQRIAVVNYPTDVVVVGSVAFVGGAQQVATYDTGTGAQIAIADATGVPGSRTVCLWDTQVAASHQADGAIHLFNATTGAYEEVLNVENLLYFGGSEGTRLFVHVGTSVPPPETQVYGAASALDLSGKTLNVYQVSASVGRGYPASMTIP